MGQIDEERQAERDRSEIADLTEGVLDRLLPVAGEYLRAEAVKLGMDGSMVAVLDVLGIVSPLSVAALAGRCSLSHAATARAVGRLVEQGYAERMTERGDGRSAWWVVRAGKADELLGSVRAGLRADLERTAAQIPAAERLPVLRAFVLIETVLAQHALAQRESRWREIQYRRWQERQRDRW